VNGTVDSDSDVNAHYSDIDEESEEDDVDVEDVI